MTWKNNQSYDDGLCGLIFLGRHPCDELAKSNQHNIRMKFQRKRSISKVLAPGAAAVLGLVLPLRTVAMPAPTGVPYK